MKNNIYALFIWTINQSTERICDPETRTLSQSVLFPLPLHIVPSYVCKTSSSFCSFFLSEKAACLHVQYQKQSGMTNNPSRWVLMWFPFLLGLFFFVFLGPSHKNPTLFTVNHLTTRRKTWKPLPESNPSQMCCLTNFYCWAIGAIAVDNNSRSSQLRVVALGAQSIRAWNQGDLWPSTTSFSILPPSYGSTRCLNH